MKRILKIFALLISIVSISQTQEVVDSIQVIRLKSGRIINGHIIDLNENDSTFTVLLNTGSTFLFPLSDLQETRWQKINKSQLNESIKFENENSTTIILSDNRKISNIDSLCLANDSLAVYSNSFKKVLPVQDIAIIKLYNEKEQFRFTKLIGSGAGALGAGYGLFFDESVPNIGPFGRKWFRGFVNSATDAFYAGIAGGLIGLIMDTAIPPTEEIDLRNMNIEERLNKIRELLK